MSAQFIKMELGWSVVLSLIFLKFPAPTDSPPVPVRTEVSWAGRDHELQCLLEAPEGAEVLLLEWTRLGLDPYVLLHRDGRLLQKHQNPVFTDRVELRDPELRAGDMSIVLKNISTDDSGVYTCHALTLTSDGHREEHYQHINLTVKPEELIVAQSGQEQVLPCVSPPGGATLVELLWTREGSDAPVLRFRNGSVKKHPTFSNRVQLRSDLSIVLKNISTDDSGVYTCHMTLTSDGQKKNSSQLIRLTVNPGTEAPVEAVGLWVTLSLIITVGVTVFIFVWECRKKKKKITDRPVVFQRAAHPDQESPQTNHKCRILLPPELSSLERRGSAEVSLLKEPPPP